MPHKSRLSVASTEIHGLELLNPLPPILHIYVLPFLGLYPFALYTYIERYEQWLHGEQANTFLLCLALLGSHALAFLATRWSATFRTRTTCVRASNIKKATLIRVVPHKHHGLGEIVPLHKLRRTNADPLLSFTYNRDKYLYEPETHSFSRLSYPADTIPPPAVAVFQNSKGLESSSQVTVAQQHYGKNSFDIPIPSFRELFAEHAVAPFFVFQLFCVGLWCLDEYWYYSLFTLFMLVVFECTVVFQRQRTLAEFRTMSIKPYMVNVFRASSWFEVQSDDLLPGDLVSITRTKEDSGVPCDLLLIQGTCIVNEAMLSGESTPLLKESVELKQPHDALDLVAADRNSILFGGTKVLQASPESSSPSSPTAAARTSPDGGCLAVVLRTGFGTSQGQLVRTMIFSTERITANNLESFLFIGFLLIFAVAASAYVWIKGVENGRPRMKLLLDCVIIITSVVPPELPMELSLAVNTSLIALSRYYVFCTEPFRIPLAGRVDVCCFDKTGTITGEDLIVEGVAGVNPSAPETLTPVAEVNLATTLTLASAHALVLLEESGVVGDPMEKTTLDALGWALSKGDNIGPAPPAAPKKPPPKIALPPPKKGKPAPTPEPEKARPCNPQNPHKAHIQVKRRFQFSSSLKRMSTISSIQLPDNNKRKLFAAVKGAPETLKDMYTSLPDDYEKLYKGYAQKGSRVLALGYKWLEDSSAEKLAKMQRPAIEGNLTFAGFLVFHCPLKPDAIKTVLDLNASSHRCIMITGDNPLTAVHVAREVEIVDRQVLILDRREGATEDSDLVWRSPDESEIIPVDASQPLDKDILHEYDLCMTGAALQQFATKPGWIDLVQHTWVYARVSPAQKEFILSTLKDLKYTTLMVGDGTNDVGALKRAHIGIALLNGSEEGMKQMNENRKIEGIKKVYETQLKITSRFNSPPPPVPPAIAHLYPHVVEAQKKVAEDIKAKRANNVVSKFDMNSIMEKFANLEEEESDKPPTIKLGDASMAAPFTSKLANVVAVVNIIRQGRCTLVATIQMYKILALNCLISAYSLSVMYLDGIKFGDYQVTISGMLMSVCFLCISRAKPIDKLSKQRPLGNIFNLYVLLSVLLQFSIHIAALLYITRLAKASEPRNDLEDGKVNLEKAFKPGLLNSSIYLLSLIQQVSTFAINFIGRPFREGITENSALYAGLLGVAAIAINGAVDFVSEFNSWLQLTPMTWQFRLKLSATMIVDYFGAWLVEIAMRKLFASKPMPEIITRGCERREARRAAEEKEAELKAAQEKEAAIAALEKANGHAIGPIDKKRQ